jgi:Protein of unknown function (DUF4236)
MGWRFQKPVKVIPGVTMNLSKSGVSTSLEVSGARVTLGHGQTRVTTGLPGTGLSQTEFYKEAPLPAPTSSVRASEGWAIARGVGGLMLKVLGMLAVMATVIAALFVFSGGSKPRKRRSRDLF